MAVLREEADSRDEETMDLASARELFQLCLQAPDNNAQALQQCINGMQQLSNQLRRNPQTTLEYQETSMMLVLLKILQQTGQLPPSLGSIGSFWIDSLSLFTSETVQRLETWNVQDYAQLYTLLQDSPRESRRKRRKRGMMLMTTTTCCTSASTVKWIALLTKMACILQTTEEVEWKTIESTVKSWVSGGMVHSTDVTAGMALAALDILSGATSSPPSTINGGVTITGLSPQCIYNMLQVPRYDLL